MEFPDLNGDSVPDAFECRPTITEILNDTEPLIVELEGPRSPKQGEIYLCVREFKRATLDYAKLNLDEPFEPFIVKRFISGHPVIKDN